MLSFIFFCRLSLQYHPDKNKSKGAQEKFAEINNAYDILSDEDKRKNFDLYGDEKGNPGFNAGNTGDQGGYTYFTNGGPGHSGFTFRPDEWQNMGGQGSPGSFSFSFGSSGGQRSFGFGLDDIFSNFFGGGMGGGGQSGGFSSSTRSQSGSRSVRKSIRVVNSQVYEKEISDKGMTWLIFSYTPTLKGTQYYEPIIEEVANSLEGALKVHDVSDPKVRRLGVDALPAVVGWLTNGEKHILKTGISVKDIKSAVQDLSALLEGFEKKNKKAASSQAKKAQSESGDKQIPLLTGSNFEALCRETAPVCIIGAFRSAKARDKLERILSAVSQKSLSRRQNLAVGSGDSISYALLDASKYAAFLNSFDKSGFKSIDKPLIAYKPRKGKYAAFIGDVTMEEVERFISSVLNGDIKFTKTHKRPTLK
ncbi:hypothetical protein U1Q18_013597 [Sarracenia purpurea var. burkii]